MEYATAYQQTLQTLLSPSSLTKTVFRLIEENKEKVIQKVKDRWKKGERPNGSIIGVYSWESYRQEKLQKNPAAGGNVDLIYKGALMRGLTLFPQGDLGFTIFSTDDKAVSLAKKYGLDAFGLTEGEIQMFFEEIQGMAIDEILNNLW